MTIAISGKSNIAGATTRPASKNNSELQEFVNKFGDTIKALTYFYGLDHEKLSFKTDSNNNLKLENRHPNSSYISNNWSYADKLETNLQELYIEFLSFRKLPTADTSGNARRAAWKFLENLIQIKSEFTTFDSNKERFYSTDEIYSNLIELFSYATSKDVVTFDQILLLGKIESQFNPQCSLLEEKTPTGKQIYKTIYEHILEYMLGKVSKKHVIEAYRSQIGPINSNKTEKLFKILDKIKNGHMQGMHFFYQLLLANSLRNRYESRPEALILFEELLDIIECLKTGDKIKCTNLPKWFKPTEEKLLKSIMGNNIKYKSTLNKTFPDYFPIETIPLFNDFKPRDFLDFTLHEIDIKSKMMETYLGSNPIQLDKAAKIGEAALLAIPKINTKKIDSKLFPDESKFLAIIDHLVKTNILAPAGTDEYIFNTPLPDRTSIYKGSGVTLNVNQINFFIRYSNYNLSQTAIQRAVHRFPNVEAKFNNVDLVSQTAELLATLMKSKNERSFPRIVINTKTENGISVQIPDKYRTRNFINKSQEEFKLMYYLGLFAIMTDPNLDKQKELFKKNKIFEHTISYTIDKNVSSVAYKLFQERVKTYAKAFESAKLKTNILEIRDERIAKYIEGRLKLILMPAFSNLSKKELPGMFTPTAGSDPDWYNLQFYGVDKVINALKQNFTKNAAKKYVKKLSADIEEYKKIENWDQKDDINDTIKSLSALMSQITQKVIDLPNQHNAEKATALFKLLLKHDAVKNDDYLFLFMENNPVTGKAMLSIDPTGTRDIEFFELQIAGQRSMNKQLYIDQTSDSSDYLKYYNSLIDIRSKYIDFYKKYQEKFTKDTDYLQMITVQIRIAQLSSKIEEISFEQDLEIKPVDPKINQLRGIYLDRWKNQNNYFEQFLNINDKQVKTVSTQIQILEAILAEPDQNKTKSARELMWRIGNYKTVLLKSKLQLAGRYVELVSELPETEWSKILTCMTQAKKYYQEIINDYNNSDFFDQNDKKKADLKYYAAEAYKGMAFFMEYEGKPKKANEYEQKANELLNVKIPKNCQITKQNFLDKFSINPKLGEEIWDHLKKVGFIFKTNKDLDTFQTIYIHPDKIRESLNSMGYDNTSLKEIIKLTRLAFKNAIYEKLGGELTQVYKQGFEKADQLFYFSSASSKMDLERAHLDKILREKQPLFMAPKFKQKIQEIEDTYLNLIDRATDNIGVNILTELNLKANNLLSVSYILLTLANMEELLTFKEKEQYLENAEKSAEKLIKFLKNLLKNPKFKIPKKFRKLISSTKKRASLLFSNIQSSKATLFKKTFRDVESIQKYHKSIENAQKLLTNVSLAEKIARMGSNAQAYLGMGNFKEALYWAETILSLDSSKYKSDNGESLISEEMKATAYSIKGFSLLMRDDSLKSEEDYLKALNCFQTAIDKKINNERLTINVTLGLANARFAIMQNLINQGLPKLAYDGSFTQFELKKILGDNNAAKRAIEAIKNSGYFSVTKSTSSQIPFNKYQLKTKPTALMKQKLKKALSVYLKPDQISTIFNLLRTSFQGTYIKSKEELKKIITIDKQTPRFESKAFNQQKAQAYFLLSSLDTSFKQNLKFDHSSQMAENGLKLLQEIQNGNLQETKEKNSEIEFDINLLYIGSRLWAQSLYKTGKNKEQSLTFNILEATSHPVPLDKLKADIPSSKLELIDFIKKTASEWEPLPGGYNSNLSDEEKQLSTYLNDNAMLAENVILPDPGTKEVSNALATHSKNQIEFNYLKEAFINALTAKNYIGIKLNTQTYKELSFKTKSSNILTLARTAIKLANFFEQKHVASENNKAKEFLIYAIKQLENNIPSLDQGIQKEKELILIEALSLFRTSRLDISASDGLKFSNQSSLFKYLKEKIAQNISNSNIVNTRNKLRQTLANLYIDNNNPDKAKEIYEKNIQEIDYAIKYAENTFDENIDLIILKNWTVISQGYLNLKYSENISRNNPKFFTESKTKFLQVIASLSKERSNIPGSKNKNDKYPLSKISAEADKQMIIATKGLAQLYSTMFADDMEIAKEKFKEAINRLNPSRKHLHPTILNELIAIGMKIFTNSLHTADASLENNEIIINNFEYIWGVDKIEYLSFTGESRKAALAKERADQKFILKKYHGSKTNFGAYELYNYLKNYYQEKINRNQGSEVFLPNYLNYVTACLGMIDIRINQGNLLPNKDVNIKDALTLLENIQLLDLAKNSSKEAELLSEQLRLKFAVIKTRIFMKAKNINKAIETITNPYVLVRSDKTNNLFKKAVEFIQAAPRQDLLETKLKTDIYQPLLAKLSQTLTEVNSGKLVNSRLIRLSEIEGLLEVISSQKNLGYTRGALTLVKILEPLLSPLFKDRDKQTKELRQILNGPEFFLIQLVFLILKASIQNTSTDYNKSTQTIKEAVTLFSEYNSLNWAMGIDVEKIALALSTSANYHSNTALNNIILKSLNFDPKKLDIKQTGNEGKTLHLNNKKPSILIIAANKAYKERSFEKALKIYKQVVNSANYFDQEKDDYSKEYYSALLGQIKCLRELPSREKELERDEIIEFILNLRMPKNDILATNAIKIAKIDALVLKGKIQEKEGLIIKAITSYSIALQLETSRNDTGIQSQHKISELNSLIYKAQQEKLIINNDKNGN